MPIFEYQCLDCGKISETISFGNEKPPVCGFCGGKNMKKCLSPHSSMSGPLSGALPGPGDTACCGSSPGEASGCAGPGSCCGKTWK
jgi:putative FmdB family regulatory protein